MSQQFGRVFFFMADENQPIVAEDNGKNPGTEPNVSEQPDLGASVGPGEDYDQVEEEEAPEVAAKPEPPDPTKGMSPREAAEYWRNKANHFESEYKVERTKRQTYDKQYGGLNNTRLRDQTRQPQPDQYRQVPDNITDLGQYTNYLLQQAEKSFEHKMTERQLDAKVESSEENARKTHDGEDGLPTYDELFDEQVAPMIQKNPRIYELLRLMPDPAEATYVLGFIMKYKNFAQALQSHSRDDLMKAINQTAKQAATIKGKAGNRSGNGKLSKEEIEAMTPEDFERELEKFRAGA